MTKRVSLTDLLADPVAADAPAKPTTEPESGEATPWPTVTPSAPKSTTPAKRARVAGKSQRYDELERKETRIRGDQYEALTRIQRALNKARGGEGERITENTLIRVAIDLLLAGENSISGRTEAEIRNSVGL